MKKISIQQKQEIREAKISKDIPFSTEKDNRKFLPTEISTTTYQNKFWPIFPRLAFYSILLLIYSFAIFLPPNTTTKQGEKVSTQLPNKKIAFPKNNAKLFGNVQHRIKLVWRKITRPVIVWYPLPVPKNDGAKMAYLKRRKALLRHLNQSYHNC